MRSLAERGAGNSTRGASGSRATIAGEGLEWTKAAAHPTSARSPSAHARLSSSQRVEVAAAIEQREGVERRSVRT
eukprot:scaffold258116_cov31-Tisochrysis_lutea.AAC.1